MKDFKKALHFFSFFKKKTNAFLGLCRRARSPKVHRQQDVVYVVNRRRTMRLGFRLPRMASMPKTDRTRRAKVRGCQGWHLRRDPTAHDVQRFAAAKDGIFAAIRPHTTCKGSRLPRMASSPRSDRTRRAGVRSCQDDILAENARARRYTTGRRPPWLRPSADSTPHIATRSGCEEFPRED